MDVSCVNVKVHSALMFDFPATVYDQASKLRIKHFFIALKTNTNRFEKNAFPIFFFFFDFVFFFIESKNDKWNLHYSLLAVLRRSMLRKNERNEVA